MIPIRHLPIKLSHYYLILLFFTANNLVLELRAEGLGKKGRIEDVKESRWKKKEERRRYIVEGQVSKDEQVC